MKFLISFYILLLLITGTLYGEKAFSQLSDKENEIVIRKTNYTINIGKEGFKYSLSDNNGNTILAAHKEAGLVYLNSPVRSTKLIFSQPDSVAFEVENSINVKAIASLKFYEYHFKISVKLEDKDMQGTIYLCTKGTGPSYGLSDHAAFRKDLSTEVSGFSSNYFGALTDDRRTRLASNFVISPSSRVAFVNMDPSKKIVGVSDMQWKQGTAYTNEIKSLYYFTGNVKQIYADFLTARNREGYKVYPPKYEWFGVGWEAFGALGWVTNHRTIKENIDKYLKYGFPLSWMVIGSGFWPNQEERLLATTSFGAWDKEKYPDPEKLISYFKDKNLKVILGLRISFIPNGLYTDEGIKKSYFIKKKDKPRLFSVGFPKPDCYFLDGKNPEAVKWYINLCEKWLASGVDGFKEDLYGYDIEDFNDDRLDAVNSALMDKGVYVMGRNGYLGSPMDLHRFEDFNYNQNQDRGPVNGLSFSYSGFPYTYPDIVGGTGLSNRQFGKIEKKKLSKYLMRYARYASVNPSMAFGFGVWELNDPQVLHVCVEAAKMHHALQPYIYNAAIKSHETGFPYVLTPLPLAFEKDKETYKRENAKVRGYQWMIGEALMATPLYGNDYEKVDRRDIYLPEGNWIDYDNGKVYKGPMMLKDFDMPVTKTPLFVGGNGVVVEQHEGKLYARVYHVGFSGNTSFFHKNGSRSQIIVKKTKTKYAKVTDLTTRKKVKAMIVRHALQFELFPEHNYKIE